MATGKVLKIVDDIIDSVSEDNKEQNDDIKYVMGLDASTQSLTISIFDTSSNANFKCIASININFDKEFAAKYGVKNGVIKNEQTHEVTAPTLMFIDALDIGLHRLQNQNKDIDFSKIISISGSGQQHGSVYWKKGALISLKNMNPKQTLLENLSNCFAINYSPIWMDSSTKSQCQDLEFKVGSALKVAQISGSRAYERFTGNQIAKISQLHHE